MSKKLIESYLDEIIKDVHKLRAECCYKLTPKNTLEKKIRRTIGAIRSCLQSLEERGNDDNK